MPSRECASSRAVRVEKGSSLGERLAQRRRQVGHLARSPRRPAPPRPRPAGRGRPARRDRPAACRGARGPWDPMVAADEQPPRGGPVRLAKFLAHAGVASRRGAEAVIAAGRVTVDGRVVTDPALDVGEGAQVAVDGRAARGARAAGPLRAQQAPGGRLDRQGHPRPADRPRPDPRRGPAPLSGRAAGHRLDRPDPADQRRRAGQPPDPSPLRDSEDLRRRGRAGPGRRTGDPQAARRG